MNIPSGNVTFLFTDIEGSTKLSQKFPDIYQSVLQMHSELLQESVNSNGGFVFKTIGDAFCCAFENAYDAVTAAIDIQIKQSKQNHSGPPINIRMGLHTGKAEYTDNDYTGYLTLVRTQRIMSVAYGGQILITQDTYDMIKNKEENFIVRNMGERKLKDLTFPEFIYQISTKELRSDFPQLKTLDVRPNNLPIQSTSFIGRKNELASLKELLRLNRLITLLGTGGTGKTRLSIQTGNETADNFENGVWFVSLAQISDPANIEKEIASVLKINSGNNSNTTELITDFLKHKELLLILDNCEHLIKDCAIIADSILSMCPKVKILASSREQFRIAGEVNFYVAPLELPELKKSITPEHLTQFESVKLFIDRAVSVNQNFKVTISNMPHLAELCHRLDGIPLAIELAAARTRVLSVQSILEKITSRFKLLTGGSKTALPHQQTLKTLIDWSYDLLSVKEKILFVRLSVFSGGWTLDAAEEVCSDENLEHESIMDIISNLFDKSLIVLKESDNSVRYNMLETIRHYAIEKSEFKNEIQKKHFNYFFNLCKSPSVNANKGKLEHIKNIAAEKENIRTALSWAIENETKSALNLANELSEIWELNGNISEGFNIYKKIFEKNISFENELAAIGLITAGFLASQLGEYDISADYLNKSLEFCKMTGNKILIAECLNNIGNLLFLKNELKEAQKFHEEALSIGNEENHNLTISTSLINLASIKSYSGNYDEAISFYERGLNLMHGLNDELIIARIMPQLAYAYTRVENIEKAKEYYEECLPILKEYEDHIPLSIALLHLGDISLSQSLHEEAEDYYEESVSITREYGYKNVYLYALAALANLKLRQGDFSASGKLYIECMNQGNTESDKHQIALSYLGLATINYKLNNFERSCELFGISFKIFDEIKIKMPGNSKERFYVTAELLKEKMTEEKFEIFFEKGKSLQPDFEDLKISENLKSRNL